MFETLPVQTAKPAAKSLTIQGLAVVALGLLTRWLGLEMDEASLGQVVGDAFSLIGIGMTAWGRARATGSLILRSKQTPPALG